MEYRKGKVKGRGRERLLKGELLRKSKKRGNIVFLGLLKYIKGNRT